MKEYKTDYAQEWDCECETIERAINAIWHTDHEITIEEFAKSGEDLVNAILAPLVNEESSCIEIGCGIGRFILPLSRITKEAVGFDISIKMIELAKTYCEELNATFVCSEPPYPVKNNVVDLVFSHLVLQHMELPDMLCVMKEASRMLKRHGHFVCSFANLLCPGYRHAIIDEMIQAKTVRASHIRAYTPETITLLLNHFGFAVSIFQEDTPTFFVDAIKTKILV